MANKTKTNTNSKLHNRLCYCHSAWFDDDDDDDDGDDVMDCDQ